MFKMKEGYIDRRRYNRRGTERLFRNNDGRRLRFDWAGWVSVCANQGTRRATADHHEMYRRGPSIFILFYQSEFDW